MSSPYDFDAVENIMSETIASSKPLPGRKLPKAKRRGRRPDRDEIVFYDSSVANRTMLGRINHLCCAGFNGWYKLTSERVLYSKLETRSCVGIGCPSGRALDYFDSDVIVDVQAHQNLSQIIFNEGNLIVFKAGGDASDNSTRFEIRNVPNIFSVFDNYTVRLARMNLRKFTARKMFSSSCRVLVGSDQPAAEEVYFDSAHADRNFFGKCRHDVCCPQWCDTKSVCYVCCACVRVWVRIWVWVRVWL